MDVGVVCSGSLCGNGVWRGCEVWMLVWAWSGALKQK